MNGNLLTDRNLIRDMWADHFEALATLSENEHFDNAFLNRVFFLVFVRSLPLAQIAPLGYYVSLQNTMKLHVSVLN